MSPLSIVLLFVVGVFLLVAGVIWGASRSDK